MGMEKGEQVDHISHNVQDNRKSNLRKTTNAKNSSHRKGANKNCKTGVRNVHLVERGNKKMYLVQIMKNSQRYCWEFKINQFEEACNFAKLKRMELFGRYAGKG
ncbi:MAG: HNH endonuclease [Methanofastidiosum sp.]